LRRFRGLKANNHVISVFPTLRRSLQIVRTEGSRCRNARQKLKVFSPKARVRNGETYSFTTLKK
jgi:hypothetical protein